MRIQVCICLILLAHDSHELDVQIFPAKSEKEVDVGDSVTLSCKATGGDTTVTWTHGDVEVTETDRNARVHTVTNGAYHQLQLMNIEEDDSGIYTCEGAAAGNNTAEDTIELIVLVKLEVTSPTDQFGLLGQTKVLECEYKGNPAPTVSWKFANYTEIQTEGRYSIVDAGLRISDLQETDEMTYFCELVTMSTGDFYLFDVNFVVAASCSVNNGSCQGSCENTSTGAVCSCPEGYKLHQDGLSCADIDECALTNGGCSHHCVNTVGDYECTCPRGYEVTLADNKTCIGVQFGNLCEEKDPPWIPFFDDFSKLQYCFRRDPTPNTGTPFTRRTYSEATADCLSFDSKIVTPRGRYYNGKAPNMFPLDGLDRWIDIKYDRVLKMYVQNGGIPMDTRYLRKSPWDTVAGQPTYGLDGRDCTVANNDLWKNVPCADSYHFVCEYKVCPPGWSYNPFVDRCNKDMGFTETFDMATKRCSQEGAIIETPRSREAELFLKNLFTQSNPSKLWIGMMDLEHAWRWNDGAKVTWTAWDRVIDPNLNSSSTYKCMTTNGTVGDNATTWHRAECNGLRAASVCGKLRCRYPYLSHVFSGETMPYHTCYRSLHTALNARQAGQFCSEDGSESNPSRLAFPDNYQELLILKNITGYDEIWTGYAWNRAYFAWQSNNNTFDTNSNYTFNFGRNSKINPTKWVTRGHICTYFTNNTYLTPSQCYKKRIFVCEREQPYILTGCPEQIQSASRINGTSDKPLYYPRVPQSQRMNCYYDNTHMSNYAEADRYCAGLGGYIMMPKSTQRATVVTQSLGVGYAAKVWIGADGIGFSFNRDYTTDDGTNNFKYSDGSVQTNWDGSGANCVMYDLISNKMIQQWCLVHVKSICQVDHNNLRAQRNWDFLTACKPDYDDDGSKVGVPNWYAAPGDKCYHLIRGRKRHQSVHMYYCKGLSNYDKVSPAKPMSKEQTRIMVLSRSMNINELTPAKNWRYIQKFEDSYIGVLSLRPKNRYCPDRGYCCGSDCGSAFTGSYIPPEFLNFRPGGYCRNRGYCCGSDCTDHQRECVTMSFNGKWEKRNCSEWHYLSCEKPSVASLTTWRAMHPIPNDFDEASRSDMPHSGILRMSMGIAISFLLVVV